MYVEKFYQLHATQRQLLRPLNNPKSSFLVMWLYCCTISMYSITCVKRPLKKRQNKDHNGKFSLMKVKLQWLRVTQKPWSILQYF